MRVLVDTHALIWFLTEPERLSMAAGACLEDEGNDILVSAVSAYEIEYKRPLDPLLQRLPFALEQAVADEVFTWRNITPADAIRAGRLDRTHRDPWDRILAAQALGDAVPIVSMDRQLEIFGVRLIW